MDALTAEPRNQEWLLRCDPMQTPLEGETSWALMERVYFNPMTTAAGTRFRSPRQRKTDLAPRPPTLRGSLGT